MVALYVKMIREGKLTLDQVPPMWKANVSKELKKG